MSEARCCHGVLGGLRLHSSNGHAVYALALLHDQARKARSALRPGVH